ncbi:Spy/CpxP family protein refolding chaperone [Spirosoma areae]
MERTQLLTIAVIGLLLLNLLTIGFVVMKLNQPSFADRSDQRPGHEGPADIIIERLHFDQSQQQAFGQIRKAHHAQTEQLQKQMRQLVSSYYGLLASAHPDSTQAIAFSQEIAQNQQEQAQLNFRHFQEIRALCRPDQQADFTKLAGDLARLFGQQQRPPRPGADGPPDGHPGGPPENFPPRP